MENGAENPWLTSDIKSEVARTFVIPGQHCYEGTWYPGTFPPPFLERIKAIDYRDDDVVMVSYPKSGNNWTQKILGEMMNFVPAPEKHLPFHLMELAFKINPNLNMFLDDFETLPSPRTASSHLDVSFFKKALETKKTKFIVVLRNPKDVMVSYYYFFQTQPFLGHFPGTFDDFMEMVQAGRVPDWFDWIQGWWQYKDHPNVIFVKYEDMKKDLATEIKRLAKFLNIDVTEETLQKTLENSTVSAMKKEFDERDKELLKTKSTSFVRKGIIGDWKNHFNDEQNNYVDKKYKEIIDPLGLTFDFE